jgi:hypothetical protein
MFMLLVIILAIVWPLVIPVSVTVFHAVGGARRRRSHNQGLPIRARA